MIFDIWYFIFDIHIFLHSLGGSFFFLSPKLGGRWIDFASQAAPAAYDGEEGEEEAPVVRTPEQLLLEPLGCDILGL